MSGSGGGFSDYGTISAKLQLHSSEKGVQSSQREIEINEFLEQLLKEFNSRNSESIRKHLNEIAKVLGKEIDGIDAILFGGSIAKSTFIEGTSDVDALVFLDSAKFLNMSPIALQDSLYEMLQKRFPQTDIQKGRLAVTIKFADYDIQLLPALRESGKIRIMDQETNGWSKSINLNAFTSKLTKTNKMNCNKVVPVIKLTKNLFSKLPQRCQLSGYHVEALAVEAFSVYNGRNTLYDMTKYLLDYSVKRVLSPMNDITGQSGIIDDRFGTSNSLRRQNISHYIKNIAGRFSGSDAASVTKELFNFD